MESETQRDDRIHYEIKTNGEKNNFVLDTAKTIEGIIKKTKKIRGIYARRIFHDYPELLILKVTRYETIRIEIAEVIGKITSACYKPVIEWKKNEKANIDQTGSEDDR